MIAKHDRFIAVNMGSPRAYVGLPERMRVLAAARADCNRLFLGRAGPTPQIRTVSGLHWAGRMKGFAAYAGVDWRLSPHQLRRA